MLTTADNVTNSMTPFELIQKINENFADLEAYKQTASELGNAAFKAVASGGGVAADSGKIVLLGSDGKIPNGYIGDLFSNEFFSVATYAGLVNLSSAKSGDFAAVVADENNGGGSSVYVLTGAYSTAANWKSLKIPCAVSSVNGKTGVVVIGIADISGLQAALDSKVTANNGAGGNIKVAFTQAATLANIATGESLATMMGKLSKLYASLGSMAYKSSVGTTDFASGAKAPAATAADSATTAGKVNGKLSLNVDGTTTEYDGSAAKTVVIPALTQLTFTADDLRWSTISNGYKLTITTTKKSVGGVYKVKSSYYEEVFAGVEYGSGVIYVSSTEKFAGCVYVI